MSFNPRPRVGGYQQGAGHEVGSAVFQSTPPCRGLLEYAGQKYYFHKFQSTPPCRGLPGIQSRS